MLYLITHKYVKMATAEQANTAELPTPLQDTYGYIKKYVDKNRTLRYFWMKEKKYL